MPAQTLYPTPIPHVPYPALYLYPLNDSFAPKHIPLAGGQRQKIGRQTNTKTTPGERNGYFDSKVLSRQHAEVWEEGGKIYIKDVKSSNGTFINGERLSPEGADSEPWQLNSDDIVEFGIDIVGEDNKTIVHHKVAARVVCVFTEQDVQIAMRAEQHQQQQQQQQQQQYQQAPNVNGMMNQVGVSSANGGPVSFSFNGTQQRRSQLSQQGLAGMGGMGGNMRPPGKSGLTFDHILSRLQGELQKSRETGAELNSLTDTMNEIHETLGGGLPPTLPVYPATLPPVRPSTTSSDPSSSTSPDQAASSNIMLKDLQDQLQNTQASLASHVEKVRSLEGILEDQDAIKKELRTLREIMESRRLEIQLDEINKTERHDPGHLVRDVQRDGYDFDEDHDREHDASDDEDDARSIHTVVTHELESVEEEDEEQLADEERRAQDEGREMSDQQYLDEVQDDEHDILGEREPEVTMEEERERRRDQLLGRPRTPEPTHLGRRDPDAYCNPGPNLNSSRRSASSPLSQSAVVASATTDEVLDQLMKLSAQFGAVVALTASLEQQHVAAQGTIQMLEEKVRVLEERLVTAAAAQKAEGGVLVAFPAPSSAVSATGAVADEQQVDKSITSNGGVVIGEGEKDSLTGMLKSWMSEMEGKWNNVQEEWDQERERLNKARVEWEGKARNLDTGLEKLSTLQAATASIQQHIQAQQHYGRAGMGNGDAVKHSGPVTPPSPVSQSSDSNRFRRRRRKSASTSSDRSNSESPCRRCVELHSECSSTRSTGSRGEVGRVGVVDTDTGATLASVDEEAVDAKPTKCALPLCSFRAAHTSSRDAANEKHRDSVSGDAKDSRTEGDACVPVTPESSVDHLPGFSSTGAQPQPGLHMRGKLDPHSIHFQTAVGVLVLGVAAAAVFYKVKPE